MPKTGRQDRHGSHMSQTVPCGSSQVGIDCNLAVCNAVMSPTNPYVIIQLVLIIIESIGWSTGYVFLPTFYLFYDHDGSLPNSKFGMLCCQVGFHSLWWCFVFAKCHPFWPQSVELYQWMKIRQRIGCRTSRFGDGVGLRSNPAPEMAPSPAPWTPWSFIQFIFT